MFNIRASFYLVICEPGLSAGGLIFISKLKEEVAGRTYIGISFFPVKKKYERIQNIF